MSQSQLTTDDLERALRALRRAEPLGAAVLHLQLLQTAGPTRSPAVVLEETFLRLTLEHLQQARSAAGVPTLPPVNPTREHNLEQLAADFSASSAQLEAWSAVYHRYLSPLDVSARDLAAAAHVAPRQFRRRLAAGLEHLLAALQRADEDVQSVNRLSALRRHIPPPEYLHFVGHSPLRARLLELLQKPCGPGFISLEGLGGIGKTALARAAAWDLAAQAELSGVAWVSARPAAPDSSAPHPIQRLDDIVTRISYQLGQDPLAGLTTTARLENLRPLLHEHPYLVVIDNLETLDDVKDVLPHLFPLSGQTRFLLTSRTNLSTYPFVQVLPVPELSIEEAHQLVTSELVRRGHTAGLSREVMAALFAHTGGLPLALKLAAAQLTLLPFDAILADLQHAANQDSAQLYTHIYRQSWGLLEDPARQLLLSMLMSSPDGETLPWLQAMSGLAPDEFTPALRSLQHFSLIEVGGGLGNPTYRLHRLTATFLQTNILQRWV